MKVKFLKDLHSVFGTFFEGEGKTLELEAHIVENWIETGYCKLVKEASKLVTKDVNEPSTDK